MLKISHFILALYCVSSLQEASALGQSQSQIDQLDAKKAAAREALQKGGVAINRQNVAWAMGELAAGRVLLTDEQHRKVIAQTEGDDYKATMKKVLDEGFAGQPAGTIPQGLAWCSGIQGDKYIFTTVYGNVPKSPVIPGFPLSEKQFFVYQDDLPAAPGGWDLGGKLVFHGASIGNDPLNGGRENVFFAASEKVE